VRGWRSRLAALFVALTATAYLSTAAKADKAVALSGVDGGAHSFYGYAGGIAALDETSTKADRLCVYGRTI